MFPSVIIRTKSSDFYEDTSGLHQADKGVVG